MPLSCRKEALSQNRGWIVGDPDITEKLSTSGVTNTLQVGKTDAKLIYCEAVVFALSAGLLGCQAGPPSSHWSSVSC